MGLSVNDTLNGSLLPRQQKNSAAKPVYMRGNYQTKPDKSNDGKFSSSQALKNFALGLVSPVTGMFENRKNFITGAAMILGSTALLIATGGAAAPLLVTAGIAMGAVQAGSAAYKIAKAQNGDDVEKAFYDIGGATSTIGLSAWGAKHSLKQIGVSSKEINAFTVVKKCIASTKNSSIECLEVLKSGYWKTHFNNIFKLIKQPKSFIKWSKELHAASEKPFKYSVDAVINALPEEFRPYLKSRLKCEMSIYSKMVRESTLVINERIKKIKANTKLSPEAKQQEIQNLLAERSRIQTDPQFAKSKIEDLIGLRLAMDDISPAKMDKLIQALVKAVNDGVIEIIEIENYRGINTLYKGENNFYLSDAQLKELAGAAGNIKVRNSSKKSGYTAVQLKIKPKDGQVIELQIRGKEVDAIADAEHIPYDLRQGKDIAKGNNKIGILLSKVQKAIKSLTETQYREYQKYLYDNYIYAQAQELSKKAVKPELPEGIDPILSMENLKKLRNQTRGLSDGVIKKHLNLTPQLALAATGNSE